MMDTENGKISLTSKQRRELIYKLREKDELSFEAISKKLFTDYGIVTSKQSVFGIYKRLKGSQHRTSKEAYVHNMIIEIQARTDDFNDTVRELQKIREMEPDIDDSKCTKRYVSKVVGDNPLEVEAARIRMKQIIKELDYKLVGRNIIEGMLKYRDVHVSDEILFEIVSDIAIENIVQGHKEELKALIEFDDFGLELAGITAKKLRGIDTIGSITKLRNSLTEELKKEE